MVRSFGGWTNRILLAMISVATAVLFIYGGSAVQITTSRQLDERQPPTADQRNVTDVPDQRHGPAEPSPGSPADRPPPASPSFYLYQPRLDCSKPNTYIVYVYSDVRRAYRRELIRNTWARPDRYNDLDINIHVFFVVGTLDPNATNSKNDVKNFDKNVNSTDFNVTITDDDIKRQLLEEIEQHQDILVCDVIDSYRNLTLKGLAALEWINSTCDVSKVDFVFKTDDDVYVNLPSIFQLAKEAINSSAHFLCIINNNSSVHRRGKWAVPAELFQPNVYPEYCAGAGYGLTRIGLRLLLDSVTDGWRLPIEDVYFTSLAIRRRHPEVDIVYYPIDYQHARMTFTEERLERLRTSAQRLHHFILAHPVPRSVWFGFHAAVMKHSMNRTITE